jgi:hypothetical protein
MEAYLEAGDARRRLLCDQAQAALGLPAAGIEKDFWVCWTLRALFGLDECRDLLTFKGGTSLSKAWNLIHRFSEDIDLVVDRRALGFELDVPGMQELSGRQRTRRMAELRRACRRWVRGTLLPALAARVALLPHRAEAEVLIDPEAVDGDRILFRYPSAIPSAPAAYLRRDVKIELVARADDWPCESRAIVPYVAAAYPAPPSDATFVVRALTPERTFWEKAMLLHEETFRPSGRPPKARLSRHYYDLWCLIEEGTAARAARDPELFRRVAEHRQLFFPWTWVDYATLRPGSLRLLPSSDHLASWETDYAEMRREMFFGEAPKFAEVLRTVGLFEQEFNRIDAPPPSRVRGRA